MEMLNTDKQLYDALARSARLTFWLTCVVCRVVDNERLMAGFSEEQRRVATLLKHDMEVHGIS